MNENIELTLILLLVGMVTVFLVLILVYSLGNAIVRFVNRFFPEGEQAIVASQATGVNQKHLAVIAAAVATITGGRGKVLKVEKES